MSLELWQLNAISFAIALAFGIFIKPTGWACVLGAFFGWLLVLLPSCSGMHNRDLSVADASAEAFFYLLVMSPAWLVVGILGVLAGRFLRKLK